MASKYETGDFRGGILGTVSGVAPQTIHSWKLDLGIARDQGHRRYTAADAVALRIMVHLVHQGIGASTGRSIVIGIRQHLPQLVARFQDARSETGIWPWDGGPVAVVKSPRPSNPGAEQSAWLNFVECDDLAGHILDRSSGQVIIVIPLWRIIAATLLKLQQIEFDEIQADATDTLDQSC